MLETRYVTSFPSLLPVTRDVHDSDVIATLQLDLTALAVVTDIFTAVISDFTLSASVHTIAVRLLFQVITVVYSIGNRGLYDNDKDPSKARSLLVQIATCHVARLQSLSRVVDKVLLAVRVHLPSLPGDFSRALIICSCMSCRRSVPLRRWSGSVT
jgi:hypothetical protein